MTRSTQHKAHNVRRLRLEVEGDIWVTVVSPDLSDRNHYDGYQMKMLDSESG